MTDTQQTSPSLFSVEHPLYKYWLAITLIVGMLMMAMDWGMMQVAVPKIMVALKINMDKTAWLITAPMIVSTVITPMAGWLSSLLGVRRLYVISSVISIIGMVLCGFAWDANSLITFRLLNSAGGGIRMPLSMAILFQTFPPDQRGLAMGIFMAGVTLGPSLAPTLGGYIIDEVSWRAIFYATIPFGVVSLALFLFLIPKQVEPKRQMSIDIVGLISMATFLTALSLALTQGREEGWDSTYIQTLFTTASIGFIVFIITELKVKNPVVDLKLFRNIPFAMACTVRFMNGLEFMGMNFLVSIFIQRVLGYTPYQAGILMLPSAIVSSFTGLIAGRLSDKIDSRLLVIAGLGLTSLALYRFSFVTVWTTTAMIVMLLTAKAGSRAFLMTPISNAALRVLPPEKVTMGSGFLSVMMILGGIVGFGLTGYLFVSLQSHHSILYGQNHNLSLITREAVPTLKDVFRRAGDMGDLAQIKSFAYLRAYFA
ncbi:MAG: DHA2 family efflux MFS transporter permease subunit, partial [Candidatus Tectomicrobia bacterium]|nr:DHA2 family efflux MFS transporter permease subunit [Candidatus Tectomicrobia bacterium]